MGNATRAVDEIFVSYSRKDQAFVRRLTDELRSHGRNPWVDWDMQPLERWEQSLRHAIDRAVAVIVVLSQDWLDSRECAKELQRATEQHKRIVPLLYRAVNHSLVDGGLQSIQWIDFSDDEKLRPGIEKLLIGLDQDPEWRRQLAQLLTQAVRWDESGRDVSQTLRGRQLRDAEQLMAAASANEPKPTELQALYVMESRKAVARRQRVTLGSIAFAALVAVALSIVAYFQSQERARQERIAAAKQLVNQAEVLRDLPGRPEGLIDSVRIGVRAVDAAALLNEETAAADESVRRGLDLLPDLPVEIPSNTVESRAAAFDSHGRHLAIGHLGNRISVWDLAGQRERDLPDGRLEVPGMQVRGVAITPDAQYLAVAGHDAMGGRSALIVWNLLQRKEMARIPVPGDPINLRLGLSPSGGQVYLSGLAGTKAWQVGGGGAPFHPFPSNAVPNAMDFSPDGRKLAIVYRLRDADARDRVVEILDAKTLSRQARWFESGLVRDAQWTGSGEALAVIGNDAVLMRDARNGGLRYAYRTNGSKFAISGQGRFIAEHGRGHEVTVRDGQTRTVYRRLIHPVEVKALSFGPDDKSIVTFATDARIRIWRLGHGSAFAELAHADPILELSFDQGRLITSSESQTRTWRLPGRGQVSAPLAEPVQDRSTPPVSSASLSARASEDGTRVELVAASGAIVKTLDFTGTVGAAAVSRSGRRLGVLSSPDALTRRLEVRPTLESWDLERMVRLRSSALGHEISRHDFDYLSIDPDARFMVTKTDDGFRLWDASTLSAAYVIFHGDPELIAFQPGGRLVATAGGDGMVRVWRLEEKILMEAARLRSASRLKSLVLDLEGRWIAALGEDGRAHLWLAPPEELIAQACARVPPPCERAETARKPASAGVSSR